MNSSSVICLSNAAPFNSVLEHLLSSGAIAGLSHEFAGEPSYDVSYPSVLLHLGYLDSENIPYRREQWQYGKGAKDDYPEHCRNKVSGFLVLPKLEVLSIILALIMKSPSAQNKSSVWYGLYPHGEIAKCRMTSERESVRERTAWYWRKRVIVGRSENLRDGAMLEQR